MALLGGWIFDEFHGVSLPQKVASGFAAITGDMVGADYQPILYVGHQLVGNGGTIKHCVLAVQRVISPAAPERIVKMILHEAADGTFSLASVSKIEL